MSVVTTIRDYVETLNTLSDSLSYSVTLNEFIKQTSMYLLKTLQGLSLYILSFQWIRDFTLLPIVLPQLSTAFFKETFVLETPSRVFFDFLEIPDLHQNKFLLGFLNSFFLTLPISIVHIVSVRRLLIKGIPSAVYTIGGYVIGQTLFLTCVVFGLRSILVPWLTLEPLNYVLGIILIFRMIYPMVRENLTPIQTWSWVVKEPNTKKMKLTPHPVTFLTSFVLAWCEQSSVFQYLGNLTFSSNVTTLESFSGTSPISSFLIHIIYIAGILFGAVFFTFVWGVLILQVKNLSVIYTPLSTATLLRIINKTTFVLAISLSLTSIPFYGFDYLMTGPLGFVSQDRLFNNTVFSQNRLRDVAGVGLTSSQESNYLFLDVDVAAFDRGEYLTAPNVAQQLSFEDLNYRGEFDWIARQDKVSTITDSRSGFFSLSKIFKKRSKAQIEAQSQFSERTGFNKILSKKTDVDSSVLDTHSPIIERLRKDYELTEKESLTKDYSALYKASFPTDELRADAIIAKPIEEKIKEKYYSNPVYKVLLALDIDSFLNRQPREYQLSSKQELDLDTKRRKLESYYDSLRAYSDLPYSDQFDTFFEGTKSFSNKVYNQQFKGTLRSVRRLFSLTPTNETASPQTVLKFDQPAYEFSEKQSFSPYHEELPSQDDQIDNLFNTKLSGTSPFYAGWDESKRKFVITNRMLQRTSASSQVTLDSENQRGLGQKANQKIKFTAWPVSPDQFEKAKDLFNRPYVTLSKSRRDEKGDPHSMPTNLERFELQQKGKSQFVSLTPKRGGFIWPGNVEFNFPEFFRSLTQK